MSEALEILKSQRTHSWRGHFAVLLAAIPAPNVRWLTWQQYPFDRRASR